MTPSSSGVPSFWRGDGQLINTTTSSCNLDSVDDALFQVAATPSLADDWGSGASATIHDNPSKRLRVSPNDASSSGRVPEVAPSSSVLYAWDTPFSRLWSGVDPAGGDGRLLLSPSAVATVGPSGGH
eukprot:g12962.t1